MFTFKKKNSYLLKIHNVFFDETQKETVVKTHLIGENKIEAQFLNELLEDELAIKLIDPTELIKLKEIETKEKLRQKKAIISKIFFHSNEVEIFHVDSNYYEIVNIPDLFSNSMIIKKLDKSDLLRVTKKYYYFCAPLQKINRLPSNIFKLRIVK